MSIIHLSTCLHLFVARDCSHGKGSICCSISERPVERISKQNYKKIHSFVSLHVTNYFASQRVIEGFYSFSNWNFGLSPSIKLLPFCVSTLSTIIFDRNPRSTYNQKNTFHIHIYISTLNIISSKCVRLCFSRGVGNWIKYKLSSRLKILQIKLWGICNCNLRRGKDFEYSILNLEI